MCFSYVKHRRLHADYRVESVQNAEHDAGETAFGAPASFGRLAAKIILSRWSDGLRKPRAMRQWSSMTPFGRFRAAVVGPFRGEVSPTAAPSQARRVWPSLEISGIGQLGNDSTTARAIFLPSARLSAVNADRSRS